MPIIRKTADTTRSATTTLTADPHLVIPVLANEVIWFDLWLRVTSANTTHDFKMGWTVPSGTTMSWSHYVDSTADRFVGVDTASSPSALYTEGSTLSFGTAAVTHGFHVRGWIFVSSTAGNLVLKEHSFVTYDVINA
jgi:hypothetical protein